jgi:hypothetical protein
MIPSIKSLDIAIILSGIAFITGVTRLILEVRFVPEIVSAMPEDQPGQTAVLVFVFVLFFGGWLWSLVATVRSRRAGLIALLIFNLLLSLPWGLGTVVVFCPTPCDVAWPLTDVVAWSNVIAGLIAAVAIGFYLRSTLPVESICKARLFMTNPFTPYVRQVAAFTYISWLGAFIHHRVELPQLSLLSPEHSIPIVISIVLFLAWWKLPYKRLTALTLLGWAFIAQFMGGAILSVLPFEFWPFDPPQTVQHYAVHVVYALAQLPLILALIRHLRQGSLSGANAW